MRSVHGGQVRPHGHADLCNLLARLMAGSTATVGLKVVQLRQMSSSDVVAPKRKKSRTRCSALRTICSAWSWLGEGVVHLSAATAVRTWKQGC